MIYRLKGLHFTHTDHIAQNLLRGLLFKACSPVINLNGNNLGSFLDIKSTNNRFGFLG